MYTIFYFMAQPKPCTSPTLRNYLGFCPDTALNWSNRARRSPCTAPLLRYRGISTSPETYEYWIRIVESFRNVAPQHYETERFDRGRREAHHAELLELGLIKVAGINVYSLTSRGSDLVRDSV